MIIHSLYIISKSGSLIYQKDFNASGSPISKQDENNYLVIASNLHGIHTISSKLTPKQIQGNPIDSVNQSSNLSGLRFLETELFNLFVYQSVSGLKIIFLTNKDRNIKESQVFKIQTQIFSIYVDYVMKNPFYTIDMPIRLKQFDEKINDLVSV